MDQIEEPHLEHEARHPGPREGVDDPREAVEQLREHDAVDARGLLREQLVLCIRGVHQDIPRPAQLDDHQIAQVLEKLEREGEEILPRREHLVEAPHRQGRVAGQHRLDQTGDRERARDPEHDADLVGADLVGVAGKRDHLVEQGQRVAHRTIARPRDRVEPGLLDAHALAAQDVL